MDDFPLQNIAEDFSSQNNGKINSSIPAERILVTGGGGFLGKAIVKKLTGRGAAVSSFSRKNHPELDVLGVKQFNGDIFDKKAVEKACTGIDTIFHVAAKAGVWGNRNDYFETNVVGTKNIIDACMKHGIQRLIYTSSPSVVFNGKDMEGADESVLYPDRYHAPYPETKALAEQKVIKASSKELRTISLRPHLIWGPGDNHLLPGIIKRAKRLKRIGDGKNLVDTIYVDNAADAHLLALDKLKQNPLLSGNVYFISQDEPVPLWQMVDNFLHAAGLPPVKDSVPESSALAAGTLLEFIYKIFKIKSEPPMTKFMAKELATSHWFDISAAKRDLGYFPVVSIKEGLARLKKQFTSENL